MSASLWIYPAHLYGGPLYLIKLSDLDLVIDQVTVIFPLNCFLKQLHKLDVAYRLALGALMLLGPCWLYIWGDIRHGE